MRNVQFCGLALWLVGTNAVLAQPKAVPPAAVPKLHVFVLADTSEQSSAPYWQANRDHLKRILEEGLATRPHRFTVTTLDEKTPGRDLAKAKVGAEDTVLLYFTGRIDAGTDDTILLPDSPGRMGLKEVRETLSGLKARQVVILLDGWRAPEIGKLTTAALGDDLVSLPIKASWPVIDSLLFNQRGLTEIHVTQDDRRFLLSDDKKKPQGTVSSLVLITLLCRKLDYFRTADMTIDWQQFEGFLRKETEEVFQGKRKKLAGLDLDVELPNDSKSLIHVVSAAKRDPQSIVEKTWLFGAEFTNARLAGKPVVVLQKVYAKTPAAEAGFQANDVIVSVGGKAIAGRDDFVRAIEYSEGDLVVEYRREGSSSKVDVKLRSVRPKEVK